MCVIHVGEVEHAAVPGVGLTASEGKSNAQGNEWHACMHKGMTMLTEVGKQWEKVECVCIHVAETEHAAVPGVGPSVSEGLEGTRKRTEETIGRE